MVEITHEKPLIKYKTVRANKSLGEFGETKERVEERAEDAHESA